ncbi:MAG TPA: NAD-dependent epimerase/dehydratase family protein [Kofleriaceae bacterium]|nr:NAD-dependent epimerase/dehydratase family protein [Kofleriaceae bacterium]
MKVLVTGSGGQIGLEVVSALLRGGHDVVATDLPAIAGGKRNGGARWLPLDVTDAGAVAAVFAAERPEVVYHLAAMLSARGEQAPEAAYAVNQGGTWNVLEACRTTEVRQLVFTSSIAVYGPVPGGLPDPCPEDVPLLPTTMYGVTKVANELLGAYFAARSDLDFRAVRFPGLISASLPGGGSTDYALFMYVDGVRKGAYQAFCRPDTRIPLMYIDDGVRALLDLAAAPRERLRRHVYNVAGFSPTAAEIAAAAAAEIPGLQITFRPDPLRQGILDSWPRALDDRAARAEWGWAPRYDLQTMSRHLVPAIKTLLAERADALDHDHS